MKARKLPVEIEFYPCEVEYLEKILEWSTEKRPIIPTFSWNWTFLSLSIDTLEGHYHWDCKDVVIKWIKWEVYPCKKDIFEMTYEIIK